MRTCWASSADRGAAFRVAGALLAAILLAGCEDSSTGPGAGLEIFIESPIQGDLLTGGEAVLQATLSDPSVSGTVLWSVSDTGVARIDQAGKVTAHRPGSVTIEVQLQKASAELSVRVVQRPGGYTAQEIDYLQDIAFGFEYGSASQVIRKWRENPRLKVFGTPTAEDQAVLDDVISDLNALMESVQVEIVDSEPTVEVHFAPVSQFPSILPSYVQGNLGYFSVRIESGLWINRSTVLLASDAVDQEGRSHLIREEVTQMLGLARDSFRYPESIFYQNWTTTQAYAPVDEALIEMLYRPWLTPGLGYREATDLIRTRTRRGWQGSQQRVGPEPAWIPAETITVPACSVADTLGHTGSRTGGDPCATWGAGGAGGALGPPGSGEGRP